MVRSKENYLTSIIRNSVYLNVFISIGLAFAFLVFGRTILSWIQTPPELLDGAYTYLVIVGISLIFQSVMTSFSTLIFRSFTFVKVVMMISNPQQSIIYIMGIILLSYRHGIFLETELKVWPDRH